MRTVFVPGLQLSRAFYTEAVRPLLVDVQHAAARIGSGSEVLGFDTPRSADHEWGPRLEVFVSPTQAFAEVIGGAVFHDGLGELGPVRTALRWYPRDVWRYVLACQWRRIAQE